MCVFVDQRVGGGTRPPNASASKGRPGPKSTASKVKKEPVEVKRRSETSPGARRSLPCTRVKEEDIKPYWGMPLVFLKGQRDSRLLALEGYTYVKNRTCDSKTYWICARKVRQTYIDMIVVEQEPSSDAILLLLLLQPPDPFL